MVDNRIPILAGIHARWYAESPDLYVLFNTQAMSRLNPLIVLDHYGSLIWRGIIAGSTIGHIRHEALLSNGRDDVYAAILRLIELGFIAPVPELQPSLANGQRSNMEVPAPEVQPQLAQSAVPWYCLWEIGTACNLRCQVCYLQHFATDIAPATTVSAIADRIIESGVFYVGLLGGEPLLRPDLEQIIPRLRSAGIYVKIITNGLPLSGERARALVASGLNQIEVSFDGLSPAFHEASRGEGSFPAACAAIDHAHTAGIPRSGIVWTAHQQNLHEIDQLPGFMRDRGVTECYISPFRKTGLCGSHAPWQPLGAGELQLLHQRILHWRATHPDLSIACLSACSCGRTSVVIGETGNVRLCTFTSNSVGNILTTPLIQIWRDIRSALPPTGPAGICRRLSVIPSRASG